MSHSVTIRNCQSEIEKQTKATDEKEIMDVFRTNCAESRSLFKCDKNCGSSLADGNIPEAIQKVSDYRKYLWIPNSEICDDEYSIRDHRTALLIDDLFRMKDRNGNFDFRIGYDKVRYFYFIHYHLVNFHFS